MEKLEENKITSKILAVIFFTFLVMSACSKKSETNESFPDTSAGETHELTQEENLQTGREVILLRGNNWVYGIPGFEDNSFHALSGEYRLRSAGAGESVFSVYLSPDPLYFSKEWQPRQGTGNMQALEHGTEEEFLVSILIDDGNGKLWTAVFKFLPDAEKTLGAGTLNQMLRAWALRFVYFIALARTQAEISIPAVVQF